MSDDKSSQFGQAGESVEPPASPKQQDQPAEPGSDTGNTEHTGNDETSGHTENSESSEHSGTAESTAAQASSTDSDTAEQQDPLAASRADPDTAPSQSDKNRGATPDILDELATRNKPGQSGKRKTGRRKTGGRKSYRRAAQGTVGRTAGAGGAGSVLLWLLMLPLLAAIAYLAYQQFTLRDTIAGLNQNNQSLAGNLEELRTALAEQPTQVQSTQATTPPPSLDTSSFTARVDEIEAGLGEEIQALRQQLGQLESQQVTASVTPDFAWKVFEAEYLVNQASQKLELEADLATAVSLLERADQALAASNKPGVFAAREAIASALTRLRNVELLDRNGLYLRLENLAGTVSDLDLLSSMRQSFINQRNEQAVPVDVTEVDVSGTDSGMLSSALDFLSEVFIWREWEDRPEALLAPGQETLIKQNLRLSIKQAQIGLLNRDRQGYGQSLEEARATLQRYALTDTPGGAAVMEEITGLLQIDVNQPLPGLEQAVTTVRQLAATER